MISVGFFLIAINLWLMRDMYFSEPEPQPTPIQNTNVPAEFAGWEIYKNENFGFNFYLPENWKGYSVAESKWQGIDLTTENSKGDVVTETGPLITLRNPLWTSEKPYQDIPIMIFTISQWYDLQNEKFHIGAAPINPSELGRNSTYVFALPARYNFSAEVGVEEVSNLLDKHPLRPFDPTAPDTTSWQTYRNEELGFEFKYPNNWRYDDSQIALLFYSVPKEKEAKHKEDECKNNLKNNDISVCSQPYIQDLTISFTNPDVQISKQNITRTKINNLSFEKYRYDNNREEYYEIAGDTVNYVFSAKNADVLLKILSTFKFIKTTE